MEVLFTSAGLISLVSLTFMEIVLGIDNVVFISIVSSKLPAEQQARARNIGLVLALIPRLILLMFISWLINLKDNLIDITLLGHQIQLTEKGLVLLVGGLFLLYSATSEIHHKIDEVGHSGDKDDKKGNKKKKTPSMTQAIVQIVLLNIVFSFDSILTAVGLAKHIEVMVIAVILSLLITLAFAGTVSRFVEKHPTVKMLALSFLLMIGFLLITESFIVDGHPVEVPKGYVYFAMMFSLFVELLNLRLRRSHELKQEFNNA
ncbi:TerC family protein [Eisenibacter elegans]|jgi:predicted tellurium resistance membrane protein TerC|uniref:TerC family protein n=1 Tax=Eisenibacter elegans TaxID=997 RepID=UPI0004257FBD|nr:TerC family protein [Eisenibacter elegans]